MSQTTLTILRVARSSRPGLVARIILGEVERQGRAEMRALGAGAVYQAVKALAIVCRERRDLVVVPGVVTVEEEGKAKSITRFVVRPRRRPRAEKADNQEA
ncbi:MAG: stage V sporulation protein S [Bacillota bacterium]|nr:MAG: stage V sporulation protein S [Bacillota bacterium]